jgi:hypothetical protein
MMYETILSGIFIFCITLIVGGAFIYAFWYDIRARIWFRNFERDTATAIAEIYALEESSDDSIEGCTVISYRFQDKFGKSYEGSKSFPRSSVPIRMAVGNKIKVHYYTKYPSMFSFIDGYKNDFKSSSRVIGFFLFAGLMLWWFF